MSASVAGPGVLQNKDPFAMRTGIYDHRIRSQLGKFLRGPDPVARPAPLTIPAGKDTSPHRRHLKLGLEHRDVM
eukprot:261393-Rhodomonas_salina.1